MWVKFGWKGDMTTIIFFLMVSGDFKTKRTLIIGNVVYEKTLQITKWWQILLAKDPYLEFGLL